MATSKTTTKSTTDKKEPEGQLVRSTRKNPKFQVRGNSGKLYTFTIDNPFLVIEPEDVEQIVSLNGVELATPTQAKEYYEEN